MQTRSPRQGSSRINPGLRGWATPLIIGIPIAVVAGFISCLPVLLQQGYFHFPLYRTGLALLTLKIDYWAVAAIASLALLQLAYLLGAFVPGLAGKVTRVAFPVAIFSVSYLLAGIWFPQFIDPISAFVKEHANLNVAILNHPVTLSLSLFVLLIILMIIHPVGRRYALASQISRFMRVILGGMRKVVVTSIFLLILGFVGVHLALWLLTIQSNHQLAHRPNVIFIMADTLRADHVGCYGYDLPTTPNIDRFAHESTRFEHARSQASFTVWSVSSLMSSHQPETLFPIWADQVQTLLLGNYRPYSFFPMLSEILKEHGYTTHAVISNPVLGKSPGFIQGYDVYDDTPAAQHVVIQPTSSLVTDYALKHLAAIKDKKFFFFLLYVDPHTPYQYHPEFSYGDSPQDSERLRGMDHKVPAGMRQQRVESLRAYDSDIGYTDHHIGRFITALKHKGLYDDSLIIFFSDHGEEFLEHGQFGHTKTVYEEVLQVPLIVKLPHQRQGRVVRGTFPLIDLTPSVLAYLGIDQVKFRMHGDMVDLSSLIRSKEKPQFSATVKGVQCITDSEKKYISTIDSYQLYKDMRAKKRTKLPVVKQELYDIAVDPLEQKDLLRSTPTKAYIWEKALRARNGQIHSIDFHVATCSLWPFSLADAKSALAPDLRKRLESLGYLNPNSSSHLDSAPPRQ